LAGTASSSTLAGKSSSESNTGMLQDNNIGRNGVGREVIRLGSKKKWLEKMEKENKEQEGRER
jgi:hypothetical protein